MAKKYDPLEVLEKIVADSKGQECSDIDVPPEIMEDLMTECMKNLEEFVQIHKSIKEFINSGTPAEVALRTAHYAFLSREYGVIESLADMYQMAKVLKNSFSSES